MSSSTEAMPPRIPSQTAESLLEQSDWMRSLARRLVRDAERAEDLAQETWVRALSHPPRTDQPLRGWLATVMRNVLRQEHRGESRRSRRHDEVAREAAARQPDAEGLELLERVTLQRELVAAVLELDEPYRRTLLLRYFEDRGPKRIASEMGVPVSTVKTRLARGLERLRNRLDEDHGGDGHSWLRAILPVAALPTPVRVLPRIDLSLGAVAVNTKLVLAAVAVVSIGALGASYMVLSDSPAAEVPRPTLAAAGIDEAPRELASRPEPEVPRVVEARRSVPATITAPASGDPAPEVADAAAAVVRGRVIDVDSRPVGDVAVRLTQRGDTGPAAHVLGTADRGGSFELQPEGGGLLVVEEEHLTTVLAGAQVGAASGKECIVVVAPRISLAGRVVDANGLPVEGARVRVLPPADLRPRLARVLDYSVDRDFRTRTDSEGWFDLPLAPAIAGAQIEVRREGFERLSEAAPLVSRHDLELVLTAPRTEADTLSGVVLDPSGFPVEAARVALGVDTTTSDEDGRFTFDLGDPESYGRVMSAYFEIAADELLAVKVGYQPATLRAPSRDGEGRPLWPGEVTLRLGDVPLSISGRVVDPDGNPLRGMQVWVADPTVLGGVRPASGDRARLQHVENELVGTGPGWHTVDTDEEGRFRIDGLVDRDYRLEAMDPDTLLRTSLTEVRAGKQRVRLVMPAEASFARLVGRVVDRHGEAIAGVRVVPMCDAFVTRVQGQIAGTHHATGTPTETDENGRFELERVPRDLVYLRLDHAEGIPLEWGRRVTGGLSAMIGDDPLRVRIVMGRRCNFTVELADPTEADELSVLDETGAELSISEFRGTSRSESRRMPLLGGRSGALGVSDRAATLVLLRAGEEVRRAALDLLPGPQATIRP